MSETMVERVARALFEESPVKDPGDSELYRRACEILARAAIAAMREPTKEVLKAMKDCADSHEYGDLNECCPHDWLWQAGIDGALGVKSPET